MRKNINKIIACAFSLLIMTLSCLSGFIVSASAAEITGYIINRDSFAKGQLFATEKTVSSGLVFSGHETLFTYVHSPSFYEMLSDKTNGEFNSSIGSFEKAGWSYFSYVFCSNFQESQNRIDEFHSSASYAIVNVFIKPGFTCTKEVLENGNIKYIIPDEFCYVITDTYTITTTTTSLNYSTDISYLKKSSFSFIYDPNKDYIVSAGKTTVSDIFNYGLDKPLYNVYIPELEFTNSSTLNFSVSLSPDFGLNMNREIEGTGHVSSDFSVSITNKSAFDCQYRFYIVPTASGQLSKSLLLNYGDTTLNYNVSFVYMGYEGVIARNVENSDFFNSNVMPSKVQKCTDWHVIRKKQTSSFRVKWNQCNLKKGVNYTVYVEACKCPGIAQAPCEVFVKDKSTSNEYQICVDDVQCVFSRQFSMDGSYDIVYDPNDTTWGNRPSGTSEDYKNGIYDIKAKVNDRTGQYEVYETNLYKDKNSFLYNNAKVALGSSDFETVSTQYLSFCKYLFDFFPPEFVSIIIFSLAAVFAVFIYKAIRG